MQTVVHPPNPAPRPFPWPRRTIIVIIILLTFMLALTLAGAPPLVAVGAVIAAAIVAVTGKMPSAATVPGLS